MQRICTTCLNNWNSSPRYIRLKQTTPITQIKNYKISHSLWQWTLNYNRALADKQSELLCNQQKFQLLADYFKSSKHVRRRAKKGIDHETFVQQLKEQHSACIQKQQFIDNLNPKLTQSRKWVNHVRLEFCSDADLIQLTGFDRSQLCRQLEYCMKKKLTFYELVHLRIRLKLYLPYQTHSLFFGVSESWLKLNFYKNVKILANEYSTHFLLHGQKIEKPQFWNREKIMSSEYTPDFVYHLRHLQLQECVILNQDSTYQFIQSIHNDFKSRKATKSGHKHEYLIKIHIWSTTSGNPVYPLFVFADGHNDDGIISRCALDAVYVRFLAAVIEDPSLNKLRAQRPNGLSERQWTMVCMEYEKMLQSLPPNALSFASDPQIVDDLLKLQSIVLISDQLISDSGYRGQNIRWRTPKIQLKHREFVDDDRLALVLSSHRRSVSGVRQTCERLHAWAKKNQFCRCKINHKDAKYVPDVWRIILADINFLNLKLQKDDTNSKILCKRLLAFERVTCVPLEYWFEHKFKIASLYKQIQKDDERRQQLYGNGSLHGGGGQGEDDDDDVKSEENGARRSSQRLKAKGRKNYKQSQQWKDALGSEYEYATSSSETELSVDAGQSEQRFNIVISDTEINEEPGDVNEHNNVYGWNGVYSDKYHCYNTMGCVIDGFGCTLRESSEHHLPALNLWPVQKNDANRTLIWSKVAVGWAACVDWIKSNIAPILTIYLPNVTAIDVKNYIGKTYAYKVGLAYLRRMKRFFAETNDWDFNGKEKALNLTLYQHKHNALLIKFSNVHSKFKKSNKYDIYVNMDELVNWVKCKALFNIWWSIKSISAADDSQKLAKSRKLLIKYHLATFQERLIDFGVCTVERRKKYFDAYLNNDLWKLQKHQAHWLRFLLQSSSSHPRLVSQCLTPYKHNEDIINAWRVRCTQNLLRKYHIDGERLELMTKDKLCKLMQEKYHIVVPNDYVDAVKSKLTQYCFEKIRAYLDEKQCNGQMKIASAINAYYGWMMEVVVYAINA